MRHLLIAATSVTDRAWVDAYLRDVTPLVFEHGGEFVARSPRVEPLEGDAPDVVSVIAFPSREAAISFYESDDYAPHREARQQGSRGSLWLVPAEDVAARPA